MRTLTCIAALTAALLMTHSAFAASRPRRLGGHQGAMRRRDEKPGGPAQGLHASIS
jgi:hypothetical protein